MVMPTLHYLKHFTLGIAFERQLKDVVILSHQSRKVIVFIYCNTLNSESSRAILFSKQSSDNAVKKETFTKALSTSLSSMGAVWLSVTALIAYFDFCLPWFPLGSQPLVLIFGFWNRVGLREI